MRDQPLVDLGHLGLPQHRAQLAETVAEVGPDCPGRSHRDRTARPQCARDGVRTELPIQLGLSRGATAFGSGDDARTRRRPAIPAVDEENPDPVVQLPHDPLGLLGQGPALVSGIHGVVRCGEGDLVVRAVAQLDVPVAGVGCRRDRWRPLVIAEKDQPAQEGDRQREEHQPDRDSRCQAHAHPVILALDGGDVSAPGGSAAGMSEVVDSVEGERGGSRCSGAALE